MNRSDNPSSEAQTSRTRFTCPRCSEEFSPATQIVDLTRLKTSVRLTTSRSSEPPRIDCFVSEILAKQSTLFEEQMQVAWLLCENCGMTGLIFLFPPHLDVREP